MKGVLDVKHSTINRLIQAEEVKALDFENDDLMLTWYVTPANGKLVGKRIIEWNSGRTHVDYIAVPYADMEACEEVYAAIVHDFIDCYGEDLYFGTAENTSLFSDFAGPDDEGLLWTLSVFGVSYPEFLLDAFYVYGIFVDECLFLPDEDEPDEDEVAAKQNARLVRKVLAHCVDATLLATFPDDSAVYWEFTSTHGIMWYHRAELSYDGGEFPTVFEDYGCFPNDDLDGWGALRDIVLGQFERGDAESITELGDPLGLIGINPEDLEDED